MAMNISPPTERDALEKSPDAFRTISEVSTDLDVPQHVLRFWESKFPQVRPIKRGGGRRYYRRDDIDLLRGIRDLLYGDGYTIRGVQKLIREQGARHVIAMGRGAPHAVTGGGMSVSEPEPPAERIASHAPLALSAEPILPKPAAEVAPQVTQPQRERLSIVLSELLRLKALIEARRASLPRR